MRFRNGKMMGHPIRLIKGYSEGKILKPLN
jgi:hypothetical protein